MASVTKALNRLVPPYNNVRRLSSAAMQQRHQHLDCVPKKTSQFREFDSVKRAAVARYRVLETAHKLKRRREELRLLRLGVYNLRSARGGMRALWECVLCA